MAKDYSLRRVKVPQSPRERFAQFLASKGKRATRQRQVIVDVVFSHHDHFDADELMVHLQELIRRREISRPTVYRTLAELTEAGLIRKMTLAGRSVYEHQYGYPRHDHLHCEICNRLIEFHSAQLERIVREAAVQHDFEPNGHRTFVTGVCADCRRRQKS
ncbi:MAG TPA: Fur family transcriptional regulator [Thermoguttaceae bacterium]|nr:Fur family transcriptional regulator [Thermoguttaceae bacterium]